MKYVALKNVESKMKPRFGFAHFLVSLGIAIFLGIATNVGGVDLFAFVTNGFFVIYLVSMIETAFRFLVRVASCYFRGSKMAMA